MEPLGTAETIKTYDRLFQTVYSDHKNEWMDYLKPILTEFKERKSQARVLEVGCGIGHLLCQLDDMGFKVAGIDFSQEAVNLIPKKNLDVVCGNSSKMPWESNAFDLVCSMGSLEHYTYDIFDLLETLKEIDRVSRPGGVIALQISCFENSVKWNTVYKEHYDPNAHQFELGWSWSMWKRCIGLFGWELDTFKKFKTEWMRGDDDYFYAYAVYRKPKGADPRSS
jgi:SAM-dependent methyltransferase